MAKFNPKLVICQYFDELVRQVDLFVETALERTAPNEKCQCQQFKSVLPNDNHPPVIDINAPFEDIADSIWSYYSNKYFHKSPFYYDDSGMANFTVDLYKYNSRNLPNEMNRVDYYNFAREEMLHELDRGQKLALDNCSRNSYSNLDKLDEHVFAKNSYLLVETTKYSMAKHYNHNILQLFVFDFYLDRNIITWINSHSKLNSWDKFKILNPGGDLTSKHEIYNFQSYLAYRIYKYINWTIDSESNLDVLIIPIKRNVHLVKRVFEHKHYIAGDSNGLEFDLSSEETFESLRISSRGLLVTINLHYGVREVELCDCLINLQGLRMNMVGVRRLICLDTCVFEGSCVFSQQVADWFPFLEILGVRTRKLIEFEGSRINHFKNLRHLSLEFKALVGLVGCLSTYAPPRIDFSHPSIEILELRLCDFPSILTPRFRKFISSFNIPRLHSFSLSNWGGVDCHILNAFIQNMLNLRNLSVIWKEVPLLEEIITCSVPLRSLRNLRIDFGTGSHAATLNGLRKILGLDTLAALETFNIEGCAEKISSRSLQKYSSLKMYKGIFTRICRHTIKIKWPIIDIDLTVKYFRSLLPQKPLLKLRTLSIRAAQINLCKEGVYFIRAFPSLEKLSLYSRNTIIFEDDMEFLKTLVPHVLFEPKPVIRKRVKRKRGTILSF